MTLILATGCTDKYPLDDVLRFDQLQAKGSHNSYHLEPESPFDGSHRYSHPPLDQQLALGVRQFELDLHLTANGVFQVFHLPGGVDSETTCLRFADCLQTIKRWSDANQEHLPLLVWLEPKDEDFDWADSRYQPIAGHYGELEADILSVWPKERVLAPDEVRGGHATLPQAIESDGWPTLGALRGRIAFALLDGENHRLAYTTKAPNLEGKLLFVATSSASDPYAAFFKINDARSEKELIGGLVDRGFIITTNADSPGESDESNQARLDASLESGAQFFSSDFIAEGTSYRANVPGGAPARCNPRNAPPSCTARDIEDL